jgi:hypothetical protein
MRKSEGVMPKQQFCEMMDKTNAEQREFLFNMIQMLQYPIPNRFKSSSRVLPGLAKLSC